MLRFSFAETGFLIGIIGDAILQSCFQENDDYGLKSYFKQHGSIESLFIAGGMLGGLSLIPSFFNFEQNPDKLFIFGCFLDAIFRKTRIMPSLNSYYNHLSIPFTLAWGGIPFLMVYFVKLLY